MNFWETIEILRNVRKRFTVQMEPVDESKLLQANQSDCMYEMESLVVASL